MARPAQPAPPGAVLPAGPAKARLCRAGVDAADLVARGGEVVTGAGLHADRVARLAGLEPDVRVVPFRGAYLRLAPEREQLVRGLVYPVADPELPFLGVHLTRLVGGGVEAGPNGVLALAREGYTRWRLLPRNPLETATWPGSWRLLRRYARTGLAEFLLSLSPAAVARRLQRLVPELRAEEHLAGLAARSLHWE